MFNKMGRLSKLLFDKEDMKGSKSYMYNKVGRCTKLLFGKGNMKLKDSKICMYVL